MGSYYETSDTSFNPNTAWGGTWVEDTAGRVTVALDSGTFSPVGKTDGAETHALTIDQIPSHNHNGDFYLTDQADNPTYLKGIPGQATSGSQYTFTRFANSTGGIKIVLQNTGGSQAHNNLQPYVVVKRWHRTV